MKKPHCVVIGGTRGIGRAFVRLASQGGHVVSVIGRRPPSEQDRRLPNVRYWVVDLLDRERLSLVLAQILQERGKLAHLVFFQRYRGDDDPWAGELETSLTATKQIIERVVNEFEESEERAIVIVSSVGSRFVADEQPLSYHVVKAALNQLVRYYAVALGPQGIRVNAVSPGTVLKEESRNFYQQNPLAGLYKRIAPLGRMGTADEIATVIAFLCSAGASFITGQNLVVDGGVSLQWQETLARKLMAFGRAPAARPPRVRSR